MKAGLDGDKWRSEWNASGSGSGLPEQSRVEQGRADHEGQVTGGARSGEELCKARKGPSLASRRRHRHGCTVERCPF
jgi:hypothetical protein